MDKTWINDDVGTEHTTLLLVLFDHQIKSLMIMN
jgi:hypothetical protein